MPEHGDGPFRRESLERLSSPERLDQLLRIVDRRSWLPLLALSILVLIGLLWAIFGQIPVNVHGKGILVRPRGFAVLQAPGSGYLVLLDVRVGDEVAPGDVLGRIARPDLETRLELERAKAADLASSSREMLRSQGAGLDDAIVEFEGARPANDIDASRALARILREKELQSLEQNRQLLTEQHRLARALADSLRRRWEAQRDLRDSGVVSDQALIDVEESYMESLDRVSSLEAQLRDLSTRGLESEERYLVRLQGVADREQRMADVDREVARLEAAVQEETRIVAEQRGRILEIRAAVGDFLSPGDRVVSMEVTEVSSPLIGLIYFTVRDGKRLRSAMPIQVTPDTVERERSGSIRGSISSVSDFPVTLAEVENVVGNRAVAEALISGGHLMEVFVELELDPGTPSGFRWTSAGGPETSFSAGTTATARTAVERRPPLTFVFPFLRSAVGVD